uniref:protein-serine/threonine phosphatase n=1 Tax=Romanomermis culicivorax TaxID=13658 RepID=A0A915KAJ2_ROMCU
MTTQQPEPSTSDSEKNADGKFYVTFSPSFACGGAKKFKFKEFNRRILTLTPGTFLQTGSIIFTYYEEEVEKNVDGGQAVGVLKNFKTPDGQAGVFVSKMDLAKGVELKNGDLILSMRRCDHTTVANDMCAVCGVNLREKDGRPGERAFKSEAKFSVVHSEPNLLVACDEAKQLGGKDEQNLLETRRLALLVDLDLTLIHTTDVPIEQGLEDVHSFELCDPNFSRHVTYHVRLRPHARRFLAESSRLFELHICTFGAREYAHRVARILDPDRSLFGRRILSRDECFDQASKRNNLQKNFKI